MNNLDEKCAKRSVKMWTTNLWTVCCQKFVQYIRMFYPGKFILIESVFWQKGPKRQSLSFLAKRDKKGTHPQIGGYKSHLFCGSESRVGFQHWPFSKLNADEPQRFFFCKIVHPWRSYTMPRKNLNLPYSIRMYWTNFWQLTVHVQQNIFEKIL